MIKPLEGHTVEKHYITNKKGHVCDVEFSIICQLADEIRGEGKHVAWHIHFDDLYTKKDIAEAIKGKYLSDEEVEDVWDGIEIFEDMAELSRLIMEGRLNGEQMINLIGESCNALHIYTEACMEYNSKSQESKFKLCR